MANLPPFASASRREAPCESTPAETGISRAESLQASSGSSQSGRRKKIGDIDICRGVWPDEDVVAASKVCDLERVRELERLLGRKAAEVEVLKLELNSAS
jgi:hypothetical protein